MAKRVVLAYSGGLDTSVAVRWMIEELKVEVIACAVDVGQEGGDMEAVRQRALDAGAIESVVIDAREEYANDFLVHALRANALYEGRYPLVSALSRPVIVKHLVATARYQFARPELKGADKVLPEGLRGSGSQAYASRIWGLTGTQYIEKADPWPLNPNGELILSLKMEDKYALENIDQITKVPGIAWGEWGPGDQAMSLMGLEYLKRGGEQGRSLPGTKATGGLPPIGEPRLEIQM